MPKRAIVLVLDSFGVGATEDAAKFGDVGANTLGHIAAYCNSNTSTKALKLSNLTAMGLSEVLKSASSSTFPLEDHALLEAATFGYAALLSSGKDTTSGHWEMMGLPVTFQWGLFEGKTNSFPEELLSNIYQKAGITGSLGNCHASGTQILEDFGQMHIDTGLPIFYTSADSVFQVAAHEEHFGLEQLIALCQLIREELDGYNIGRVIARPFLGCEGKFSRTKNRKDLSVSPHDLTLLNRLHNGNTAKVIGIGKIADIFAGSGIDESVKASGIPELFDVTVQQIKTVNEDALIFTNFVDFDSEYGHRRNVEGYAKALEYFDSRLPELLDILVDDDVLVITADHGCDPTWEGSDHTREFVPILALGRNLKKGDIGKRHSFADIGQTLSQHFGLASGQHGTSFMTEL
ncbi:phosphopentomutase [Thaumasiovibrio sp. DFM-14]|uniref:phosphopentomutase n=1 Tax=Thaumasiovibrio sp. DFM-14 TaxID=3384792 RepID=UPI0039A25EA2